HHLNCLEVLESGAVRRELENDEIATPDATPADALDRCRQTADRLLAAESPYRPRQADVWQGAVSPEERRAPTFQGLLCNPSLTHLGSLEVLRLDGRNRPRELAFVAFDDLRGVVMAPPNVFRAARLFFDDGRTDEIVF